MCQILRWAILIFFRYSESPMYFHLDLKCPNIVNSRILENFERGSRENFKFFQEAFKGDVGRKSLKINSWADFTRKISSVSKIKLLIHTWFLKWSLKYLKAFGVLTLNLGKFLEDNSYFKEMEVRIYFIWSRKIGRKIEKKFSFFVPCWNGVFDSTPFRYRRPISSRDHVIHIMSQFSNLIRKRTSKTS